MTSHQFTAPSGSTVSDATSAIVSELGQAVSKIDPQSLASAAGLILEARRVFLAGAGRSGLSLRFLAMRLMHLGLDVSMVGETTTPAIEEGDILVVASGSGTTKTMVAAGETAKKVGSKLIVISTDPASPLGKMADQAVIIRAAAKQEAERTASRQYAGSLFEQAVLLAGDVMFHAIWQENAIPTEVLWRRHANLE